MPSVVVPYLTGPTDDVERALFLRRFGVPFWAQQRLPRYLPEAVLKLCTKADVFVLAFDHPHAHRTRNMISAISTYWIVTYTVPIIRIDI